MNLPNEIKLASFDLDDTLLRHGEISAANNEAIKKLHNSGCKIVINTGRGISFLPEFCNSELVDYLIVSNGSKIFDNHTRQYIDSQFIPSNYAAEIYDIVKKQRAVTIFCTEGAYSTKDLYFYHIANHFTKRAKYKFSPKGLSVFLKQIKPIRDLKKIFSQDKEILKMEWSCNSKTDPHKLVEQLNSQFPVNAVVVFDRRIELCSDKAGKGNALIKLAKTLNIPIKNVAAFGDSGNDKDALNAAGIAIAMGNSTEEIKNIADIVIGKCDDDGIAEFINSTIKEDKASA